MARFLLILMIIFGLVYVGQNSHLFVEEKVWDARLGVYRSEYHMKPEHLQKYLGEAWADIEKHIKKMQKKKEED